MPVLKKFNGMVFNSTVSRKVATCNFPTFTAGNDQLESVDRFKCPGNIVTKDLIMMTILSTKYNAYSRGVMSISPLHNILCKNSDEQRSAHPSALYRSIYIYICMCL